MGSGGSGSPVSTIVRAGHCPLKSTHCITGQTSEEARKPRALSQAVPISHEHDITMVKVLDLPAFVRVTALWSADPAQ